MDGRDDTTAPSRPNVLKQSGRATYPVCIKAKDANNYCITRANALEDNVTIYHTINGRRAEKKRTEMKVASGEWHTLRVDFRDNHFIV